MRNLILIQVVALIILSLTGCSGEHSAEQPDNVVFESGSYPSVIRDGERYYLMKPEPGGLAIYSADTPEGLGQAVPVTVWKSSERGLQNVWSPELHKIDGAWYIYFEADDGNNTDNHHIYVLENRCENPQTGKWTLRGPVVVNEEWNYGIHPSTFEAGGRRYLVWSGWEKRRTESETQCIFIAEMENPWTLKSDRVLISRPEYEWERQWINPDGSRSAYPIFVNENPEPYLSPDGKNVIINYSASGIWTVYRSLGMLWAPVGSDLLEPSSWHKASEPVFRNREESPYEASSNISLFDTPDGETLMIYQAMYSENVRHNDNALLIKQIDWDGSLPVFGEF
ncbi:MAG: glycoside hydrolase family 43 protein [Clostridium sp.]|nr:glycoside hydrolase family 43 protein [Clostridium sp.]